VELEQRLTGTFEKKTYRILPNFLFPLMTDAQDQGLSERETLLIAQDVSLMRESDRAKTLFLSHLAHEIRTPITSLTMLLRLLQQSKPEQAIGAHPHRQWIDLATGEADRLRILVEEILATASRDTLFSPPIFKKVSVVSWVLRMLRQVSNENPQIKEMIQVDASALEHYADSLQAELDEAKFIWSLLMLLRWVSLRQPQGARLKVVLQKNDIDPQNPSLELSIEGPKEWRLEPVLGMIRMLFEEQKCLVMIREHSRFVLSVPLLQASEVSAETKSEFAVSEGKTHV
jgi:signal transduction histidine kinase